MNEQNSIPTKKKNGKYVVDDSVPYRPRVNTDNAERVRELANKLEQAPQRLVNFLVDIGCECIEEAIEQGKKEIQKKITKLLK